MMPHGPVSSQLQGRTLAIALAGQMQNRTYGIIDKILLPLEHRSSNAKPYSRAVRKPL